LNIFSSRKATCSIGKYPSELPAEYQYFNYTYGSNVGGNDPFIDFCPVFTGFSNGLCSDAQNDAIIRVNHVERIGLRNSRCLTGRDTAAGKTAFCLPIACVVEDRSLRIQVDGVWVICPFKDDVIISRSGDEVVCPDPIRVCPTFYCQRDCLGSPRICDYDLGECICPPIADNSTEVVLDSSCRPVATNDTEIPEAASPPEVFYRPDSSTTTDLPDPDSSLADYYVPTSRQLKREDDHRLTWYFTTMLACATIVFLISIYLVIRRRWRNVAAADDFSPDSGDDSNIQDIPINREKHKVIASVLYDMRINEANQSETQNGLADYASETDVSMTTDGSDARLASIRERDQNSDQSSDLGDAPYGNDPLAAASLPTTPTTTTSFVFRRRNRR
jgi:Leishmanolysin